jgi:hypothetical protein
LGGLIENGELSAAVRKLEAVAPSDPYVDKGIEAYESRYRQQQMKWLTKQAAALNLQLVPSEEITG